MAEDRLVEAEAIFHTIAKEPLERRAAALSERCGNDAKLRALVERLLAYHDHGMGSFLEPGPAATRIATGEPPAQSVSDRIGPYILRERIGAGGMGEVWEAEQTEPVRRTVALKLIKAGMDSGQVMARFEVERQALAMMDHPYIAKVFDAGVTDRGRPYFVMEQVPGTPITDYCDKRRLDTRERLELFERICEGVQHAHQKAVIHRDIKPANILVADVDGKPRPRIIDFGVAKATAQKLTEKTMHTAIGQVLGTPEYMSPEQADLTSEDVDTRTDVYSLGVVLYELLVGALPFEPDELREGGLEGILKTLREKDPPRPSTKLSTLGERTTEIAQRRRTEPRRLAGQLRGDLDWIVMRALEKDRNRRYGSPQELAQDVRRHLDDQAVLAGPPSATYRAGKYVKRHRVGVGFAGVVAAGVVSAFLLVTAQNARIAAARDDAEAARDEAEAVTSTLEEMLASVDPTKGGRDVKVREMLDQTAKTLGEKFAEQPLIEARIRYTVGVTYHALGEYGAAEEQLRRAVEIRQERLGEGDPGALEARIELDRVHTRQGRSDVSTKCRKTLEVARRALGEEHALTLSCTRNLAGTYSDQGRFEEAEALQEETLEIQRRVLGEEHPETLRSMLDLAATYASQSRHEEAGALREEILEMQRRILGEEHPHTLLTMTAVSKTYSRQSRYEEAEALQKETLGIQRRVLGEEHPHTLRTMEYLADTYMRVGRYDEAEALFRELMETQSRALGEEHPQTLETVRCLAWVHSRQGRYGEAETQLRRVLEITRRVFGEGHPETIDSMNMLAAPFFHQGRIDEANAIYRRALEISRRALGERNIHTNDLRYNLACGEAMKGRRDEAIALLRDALDNGYRNHQSLRDDPDFASLHGDPEFEAIVEEARRRSDEDEEASKSK